MRCTSPFASLRLCVQTGGRLGFVISWCLGAFVFATWAGGLCAASVPSVPLWFSGFLEPFGMDDPEVAMPRSRRRLVATVDVTVAAL